jgi:PAS domain S-box-containing protein
VKQHGSVTFETSHRTKDGRVDPVEVSASYVLFEGEEYVFGFVRDIAARRQAEEALRASEARFRRLFETVSVAVIQSDSQGRVLMANPAALDLLGCGSLAELLDASLPDFLADPRERAPIARRLAEEGVLPNTEVLLKRKDGSRITVLLSGRIIQGTDAEAFVESTFIDITERKRAQELILQIAHGVAAATGAEFFHSLVEHLARALQADCAFASELLPGNAGRARTLAVFTDGCRAPNFEYDLAGTPCDHVADRALCVYPTGLRELFPQDALLTEMGMDAYAGTPLFDSRRRPLGHLAVMLRSPLTDTELARSLLEILAARASAELERSQAEGALRESERRFRELLETVQLVAVMLDTEGNITFCNESLLRLTGWSAAEIMGRSWFDLFLPENLRGEVQSMFARGLAAADLPEHYENPILTRTGASRLIAWDNTLLRSPEGQVIGSASLGRDVTEHRALEERYRQAQKLESVGRLAGGIAHDFNNLLTVINGYSDFLLRSVDPLDPIRAGLTEISNASQRAAALTRQLLAFSRRQILQPELLDLNAVVTDAAKMLERLIGEDVELILRLDPSPACVRADSGQMHQVVMNLAVNARDAMPSGGKLIIESANVTVGGQAAPPEPGLPPGAYALLSVSDTGLGMTPEVKDRVFEPFFTTKEPGKGTGLGLSTVYGIVEQSGGRIFLHTEPGQGATFRIYLPAVPQPLGPPPAPDQADLSAHRGTETILLVEDQPNVRNLARSLLARLGYNVLEASNGDEALALAQQGSAHIHLLLTDLVMPGMSGSELAARLAAIRPGLRTLYMSGYANRTPAYRDAPGFQDNCIGKPFTLAALAAKVREVLDRPPQ